MSNFRIDPKKLIIQSKVFFPANSMEMEYDVNGQLLIIPLQSKGHLAGNFSKFLFKSNQKYQNCSYLINDDELSHSLQQIQHWKYVLVSPNMIRKV